MPARNGTGPIGLGAGTGRQMGNCNLRASDDLSVIIIRFILANWKPILGFLLTSIFTFISSKLLKSNSDNS